MSAYCLSALVTVLVLAQNAPLEELEPLEPPVRVQRSAAPPAIYAPLEPPEPLRALQPNFPPGAELKVSASSLGLRNAPATDGPLIYYIPQHDRVYVLQDVIGPVEQVIGGRKGQWVYVQHGSRRGYVFDVYLEAAPPPLDEVTDWVCIPGLRVGPIDRGTTYDALRSIIGEEHLTDAEFDVGGGEIERATRVFADTDKELLIRWEVYRQTPLSVLVLGPKWRTPKGLAVGTRVSSLVALNGNHFAFYGFGWEFEGQVTSWEGGALESGHALGDTLNINLAPRRPYLDADFERLQGTTEFTSDHPMTAKVNLRVSTLTIQINPPLNP